MLIQSILYIFNKMEKTEIKSLIKKQKLNYTLDQQFYVDNDIFKKEISNCH